jgi:transposase
LRCLAANEQIAKKKERMDAKGIWRYLVEEKGIDIGQSTVRRLVARLKHKVPEAFIPLSFAPGEAMQIDWGDVTAVIGGAETPVSLFCAALPFSYAIFAAAFPNKSQESFFTGHVMAFEFFGGVPRRTIYDNLKTAVALGSGPTATKQQSFSLLEAHYAFEAVFCNAAAGWEKGGVENLVAVARAAVFVPRPQAASFQELQEVILNRCLAYRENHHVRDRKLSVREAFAEERQHLLPLPTTPFETAKVMTPKVGSDCTIRFGGTKYSVPWRFVGHTVTVRATPFVILAYHGGELIARHQRTYVRSNHQWNPDHYLELLERRPRAQENAAPLKHGQWPKEIETFRLLYRGSNLNEELVKLLRLARLAGPEALLQAVGLANQSQCPTYAQVVFQLQEMGALPTLCADPVVVEPTDLSLYDRLLKPGGDDDGR